MPNANGRPSSGSGPAPIAEGPCRCGGTGWYIVDAKYDTPGFCGLIACVCKVSSRNDRLQADLGGLAGCTFSSFNVRRPLMRATTTDGRPVSEIAQRDSLIDALAVAQAYAARLIGWLFFHGPTGSGKSHLAAAIANDAVARGYRVAYLTIGSLLAWLKEGFADSSMSVRMASLQTIDLLVIDDLKTEQRTEWVEAQMFELLNQRLTHKRATVLTSNFPPDQALDFRLADRVYGAGPVLEVVASSARRMPPPSPARRAS